MAAVFRVGMRLHVHMHTTLENSVLRHEQQPGSASFIDQGEVEAMKMLTGCRAPCVINISFVLK